MLKNVRVIYKKKSLLKFVSHLDMNRFMTRTLRRTDIPFWYTEGFNTHLYINFALPLSLGFESDYEIMELKLTDDDYSLDTMKSKLQAVMPRFIEIVSVHNPVMKNNEIAFAEFKIIFDDENYTDTLKTFLTRGEIVTSKKNKKGVLKTVNLAEKIKKWSIESFGGKTILSVILPAGSQENVNPVLLLDALKLATGEIPFYDITRHSVLNGNLEEFK